MKFSSSLIITAFLLLICNTAVSAKERNREQLDSLFRIAIEDSRNGRFDKSNETFNRILSELKISKRTEKVVYSYLATNAELAGDYKAMSHYLRLHDGKGRPSSLLKLADELSELPVQSLVRPDKDVSVEYILDSIFNDNEFKGCEIRIPVIIGGIKENVILDNGCAKFSFASESFAESHGIRRLNATGTAMGVVDRVPMSFGIADSLEIEDMKLKNLLFVIISDKYLDTDGILEVNAMLGANFFRIAGEMIFDNRKRTVTFPATQQERESNVTINANGIHLVEATYEGDSLTLQLDLGAASTGLHKSYYTKWEEHIKTEFEKDTTHVAGIGGVDTVIVYRIPKMKIRACDGEFIRKGAKIETVRRPTDGEEDGNIGNDFILGFDKAVLNLRKMYLYVE